MTIPSTPTQEANNTAASGTTVAATFGSTPTVGATIFAFYLATVSQPGISSIAAVGTGGTWTKESAHTAVSSMLEVWRGTVGTSPGTTVTATTTGTIGLAVRLVVAEWSGAYTRDTRTDNNGTAGLGTPCTTGTISPTAGLNALIFALIRRGGTFSSGPTNSFQTGTTGSTVQRVDYLVIPTTSGTYSTQWSFTADAAYDTTSLVFSQAASGVKPPPAALFQFTHR